MCEENGKIQRLTASIERGPYILREIISTEQLLQDGLSKGAYVTCLEFWDGNLYVGTSSGELIHYVLLAPPGDDGSGDDESSFTFASRVEVSFAERADPATKVPGIQQILLLSTVSKACVLCNGSISFFNLPELTPAFSSSSRLNNCTWVDGVNLNEDDASAEDNVSIMICQKSRLRLVAIGERPQRVRDIELGGCLQAVRRSDIACIADATSYSLLDVVEQRWIPLSEISSFSENETSLGSDISASVQSSQATANARMENSVPAARNGSQPTPEIAHGQDPGLDTANSNSEQIKSSFSSSENLSQEKRLDAEHSMPPQPGLSEELPTTAATTTIASQIKPTDAEQEGPPSKRTAKIANKLRPNIISINPNEFMLTIGTSYNEPGVGMFVNLDGEASRGTINFSKYPEAICTNGKKLDLTHLGSSGDDDEEPFVLALIDNAQNEDNAKFIEIKRWDMEPSDLSSDGYLLEVPCNRQSGLIQNNSSGVSGLREIASTYSLKLSETSELLGLTRLPLQNIGPRKAAIAPEESADFNDRARAEAKFIRRLSNAKVHMLVWSHNSIYWIIRNPMIIKMDGNLREAVNLSPANATGLIRRELVEHTLNELQGREPMNELEFHTLNYIRQKGSIMLFIDLMHQSLINNAIRDRDSLFTEQALSTGQVDPRALLSIIPGLHVEVIEGHQGIWVSKGLKNVMQQLWNMQDSSKQPDKIGSLGEGILQLIKRYLLTWRGKKGLASISDEREVFQTVDAALLHILLWLDSKSPPGPAKNGSIRSELNAIINHGIDCFDRAVSLLEDFKRLYVLSRLYMSRDMFRQVFVTWRRIIESGEDLGGELVDGEALMSKYLSEINDYDLVKEYGTWLASRNPILAVRVFASSTSKIRFQPKQAVEILKQGAPGAVKVFLEHLVFELNMTSCVNDLMDYYLDSILSELKRSREACSTLIRSYQTYRALKPPKPTYSQFAADLTLEASWWRDRLQLLRLLGVSHGPMSKYDVADVLSRVEAFDEELVAEMIILNSRQGRHREALRLLTHDLGDFDTAVRYCLLGGSNTYAPTKSPLPEEITPSREQQELLFIQLVEEFLKIEDTDDRMTQTSQLLERFAGWVDIREVLELLPDSWSVEVVSSFLESALRSIISERNKTMITKALANTDNLAANYSLVERQKPRFDGTV